MKVLKFGGTSIGNPDMILRVKGIIDSLNLPCVIVVSAFGGVTDKLCRISELASSGNNEYKTLLEEINEKHRQFAIKLIGDKTIQKKVLDAVENISAELREIYKGIYLLRSLRSILLIRFLPAAKEYHPLL